MPVGTKWRVDKPCADCPFNRTGPGAMLRRTLRRWGSIKRSLLRGEAFYCHKTTHETGNGSMLLCAGALAFQARHGTSSNYQRVCESLDYFAKLRAARKGESGE